MYHLKTVAHHSWLSTSVGSQLYEYLFLIYTFRLKSSLRLTSQDFGFPIRIFAKRHISRGPFLIVIRIFNQLILMASLRIFALFLLISDDASWLDLNSHLPSDNIRFEEYFRTYTINHLICKALMATF